jgi:hypothetical protein
MFAGFVDIFDGREDYGEYKSATSRWAVLGMCVSKDEEEARTLTHVPLTAKPLQHCDEASVVWLAGKHCTHQHR